MYDTASSDSSSLVRAEDDRLVEIQSFAKILTDVMSCYDNVYRCLFSFPVELFCTLTAHMIRPFLFPVMFLWLTSLSHEE